MPDDRAYLHAQWRRSNPLPYKPVHTLLDGVEGQGQYVGTYIAWGVNNNGWWGEGEIKFYHGWRRRVADDLRHRHRGLFRRRLELGTSYTGMYGVYSTPYLGMPQVIKPDGLYRGQQRFGMYRWHVHGPDPVQAGPASDDPGAGLARPVEGKSRYLPLQDDIASTSIWYQSEPHAPFPVLPGRTTGGDLGVAHSRRRCILAMYGDTHGAQAGLSAASAGQKLEDLAAVRGCNEAEVIRDALDRFLILAEASVNNCGPRACLRRCPRMRTR